MSLFPAKLVTAAIGFFFRGATPSLPTGQCTDMTGPRPANIIRHFTTEAASDAELLRRFAAARDGAAFAELVRRHGPVVLAACRRGLVREGGPGSPRQSVYWSPS